MFRRLTVLMLLLLLALPACAEEAPVLSGDMLLLQKANAALGARYGLSVSSLGLFSATLTRYGDTAIVRYSSRTLDPCLLGEYAVVITPETVVACWTHDDADPSLWRSGDLSSPVWGEPQLTVYAALDGVARGSFPLPPAQPAAPATRREFEAQGGTLISYAVRDWPDRPLYQPPIAMAKEAVRMMYGLPEGYTSALDARLLYLAKYPDGQRVWIVWMNHAHEAPVPPGSPLDPDCSFTVVLEEATWTVLDVRIESGDLG